jgi:Flp pilus assembly CpaF family ATPase
MISRLRHQAADEVGRHIGDAEAAGRPAPDPDDQHMIVNGLLQRELTSDSKRRIQAGELTLTDGEEEEIRRRVMELVFSTAPGIERFLTRTDVTDIAINGFDDVRITLRDGQVVSEEPVGTSDEELIETLQVLARRGGSTEKEFTASSPVLDLRLADGSRLAAAAWVTPRPYVSIRRHMLSDADIDDLIGFGVLDKGLASFLSAAVRSRKNILIAGGQGTGKTTLMRALLHECDPDERLIVLEQEPELHLEAQPHRHNQVLLFNERPANMEGVGAVTLADLSKAIKRFTPERIVVGEVRGPEVIDMLEALTQGIAGGICTLHADSSLGVFPRLPVYARAGGRDWQTADVLALAALGLDLVVLLSWTPDGLRAISEVRHIEAYDSTAGQIVTNLWFERDEEGRATLNANSPIPVDLLDVLVEHGYDPALLGGFA